VLTLTLALLTYSLVGEVRIWDLRQSTLPVAAFQAFSAAMQMSAVAVHPYAPILAVYVMPP
jgi:hypothetical protein